MASVAVVAILLNIKNADKMDYDGKYTGPEIDARLAQVEKNKENIKKIKSNNPFRRVVCGRRIPNENWGDVSIRFSRRPTFIIKFEDFYQEEAPMPSILKALLNQNIIVPDENYQRETWSLYYDERIQVAPDFKWITESDSPIFGLFGFRYVLPNVNAIKLLGYDENNNPIFEAINIDYSETLSSNLVIKSGQICGQGTPSIKVSFSVLGTGYEIKSFDSSYCKYRKTGNRYRVSYELGTINRKKKWSWFRNEHGIGKYPFSKNKTAIPLYFSSRIKRKIVWLRFFKSIRKGRWISPTYIEIRECKLLNQ